MFVFDTHCFSIDKILYFIYCLLIARPTLRTSAPQLVTSWNQSTCSKWTLQCRLAQRLVDGEKVWALLRAAYLAGAERADSEAGTAVAAGAAVAFSTAEAAEGQGVRVTGCIWLRQEALGPPDDDPPQALLKPDLRLLEWFANTELHVEDTSRPNPVQSSWQAPNTHGT